MRYQAALRPDWVDSTPEGLPGSRPRCRATGVVVPWQRGMEERSVSTPPLQMRLLERCCQLGGTVFFRGERLVDDRAHAEELMRRARVEHIADRHAGSF